MGNLDNLQLKVFRGRSGLEKIAQDWRRLTDRLDKKGFYHLVEWYECYMDALEKDPETMFFCVLYSGELAEAIFPFRNTRCSILGLKINILELINHPHVLFNDFIFSNNETATHFFKVLLDQLKNFPELHWDIMRLYNIADDSCAISALSSMHGLPVVREKRRDCYYLDVLPQDQLKNKFSYNFQRSLHKGKNKLARLESVSYGFIDAQPELEKAYSEFLDLEVSGWMGALGVAVKLNSRLVLFYRLLLERYSVIKGYEIDSLRYRDKAIAMGLSFLIKDTCYVHKICFDQTYKHVAPGNMLLLSLLKKRSDEGHIKTFNFISDAPWLNSWKPSSYEIFNLYICKRTLIGLLSCHLFFLKRLLRMAHRFVIKPMIKKMRKGKSH